MWPSFVIIYAFTYLLKEESLRGKPGYEHLNEPLHILIEAEAAEVPASIVDVRLKQAKDIIEELLKPVVSSDARSFGTTISCLPNSIRQYAETKLQD